ncbi:serine/threonine protein kinase [Ancylothrix sp. C2]|uniref:serine/threonine-protein kinase n=1 Tax=Ancylothrix sp. D3o TaxID=2953691 RepID=UPI0021BABA14|nr:serine/threonine-protein kinase [Ancylothrix sp. D3o]MCT7950969.1 serine/threonine protein kinase [Ancylothrix sp. D3o]
MTTLYCTQKHQNPDTNRFCSQCGEKLNIPTPTKRYRIIRELGQGGFGITYLAEDNNRFKELCVLKEFAPQIQNPQALKKAEELFQREAGVLYQLQHSQIPKFRELCYEVINNQEHLVLVQDYIPGETYRQILYSQKTFSENQILNFLHQMLPVLQHIHAHGVIHRDISPENIILRTTDKLPILIDFGGVKTAAISAISAANQPLKFSTHIGKPGYAPEEQLQHGKAYPSSDFYSLAVTTIVLLTGKEPKDLFDNYNAKWQWRKHTNISPELAVILDKMISRHPADRYQTAREILQALPPTNIAPQNNNSTQIKTLVVAPAAPQQQAVPIPVAPPPTPAPLKLPNFNFLPIIFAPFHWTLKLISKTAFLSAGVLLLAGISAWAGYKLVSWTPPTLPKISNTSTEQPQTLQARLKALNLSEVQFYAMVDAEFYQKHPELNKRLLTNKPKDEKLRQEWVEIAEKTLKKLEENN